MTIPPTFAFRIARLLDRFRKDDAGVASVEFALIFPVIMYFFIMVAEIGSYMTQKVMFERGVDIVARALRLGTEELYDPATLKQAVCAATYLAPDCAAKIHLDMGVVDVASFSYVEGQTECIDRSQTSRPVVTITPGSGNEVMVMNFCLLYDPIFPGTGLGLVLRQDPDGGFPIFTRTFYVNEP